MALLACMMALSLSNSAALDNLKREIKRIEQRQQEHHEQGPGY
jgi:hypothetical protein